MTTCRYQQFSLLVIPLLIISQGCQNPAVTDVMNQVQAAAQPSQIVPQRSSNTQQPAQTTSNAPAQQFIDIHALGKKITLHTDFGEFLGHLPKGKDKSRVYLARIDDFPLGSGYTGLDKWDMALETGFIDGLLDKGLTVAEKLDHVNPRNPSEYIGTSPQDAFYMHGINLKDLDMIRRDFKAPILLTYQIMDFSEINLSVIVYLRLIDIKSMKVLSSGLIQVGESNNTMVKNDVSAFDDAYNIVKSVADFPSSIFSKGTTIGLLNTDILNITGAYKNAPSKKVMAIENGIITGLIHNEKYKDAEPVIMEKTGGFKLKYAPVYKNIVFNTNPILYENWSEFIAETDCSFLFMYRYMKDNGLYMKIIDTNANGKVIFSKAYVFDGKTDQGIIQNHNIVAEQFKSNIDFGNLRGKKIMILDGDKQAVESEAYFNMQPTFNEMNLAIEEGMVSALVEEDVAIYEKLKTLYLKRPWMYNGKIFNLNPLYLDEWNQLKEFGVETLIVYNNLIPYEKLSPGHPDFKKVALGIRVIDISTGDILDVSEFSNLN
tara:strand:- start:7914 stop:9548 length:1635 start_codon:yes stop_codon:yes gene_type:complete